MKKYITIKEVTARPMTAGEALKCGYKTGPHAMAVEGFEVTYPDGYKSWTPAAVFLESSVNISDTVPLHWQHTQIIVDLKGTSIPPLLERALVAAAYLIASNAKTLSTATTSLTYLLTAKDWAVRALK